MAKLMTVEDVADYLSVAPKTVYQNWRTWKLDGVRIGGGRNGPLRFRQRDVERLSEKWQA